MPNVGMGEMVLILAIALIVFGPKKLPEIGKGIGKALREFNKAKTDFMDSIHSEVDPDDRPRSTSSTYTEHPSAYEYPQALNSGTEYASDTSHGAHGTATDSAHYSVETEGEDALPYGADFHAADGDSQPAFRTAPPEAVPVGK